MKLEREQLIPGRWYHAIVYDDEYFMQFEKLINKKDIYATNYYYKNMLNRGSCNWADYDDITTLEEATELPSGEKLLTVETYEIY